MKSANRTTFSMLILAAISVAVAMYYYPWPEFAQLDEAVGKPLFEEYSADKVRGIDIIKFNSDKQTLDRIKLSRQAEKWVVPARQNFIATNTEIIGLAINSLNDRTVYEVISENQEDHIKYGVLDPADATDQANIGAIGQKLTLTDRNNKTIADLIVGSARKDAPLKRYVRIPGKPRIYTIDFDSRIMNTRFAAWISPNVLGIRNDPERQIRTIDIENYKVTVGEGGVPKKETSYRATVVPVPPQDARIKTLQIPSEGKWKELPTTPAQDVALKRTLFVLFQFLIDDVRKKKPEVADALFDPTDSVDESVFQDLAKFGFVKTGFNKNRFSFDSSNGQVSVSTTDGVRTTFSIGTIGNNNSSGVAGEINQFVMINSRADYDFLKKPQRPPNLADDESEANKQFRRLEASWKEAVERATRSAREMNEIHGDWYYLVSERIIKALCPDLSLPKVENTVKKSPAENKQELDEAASENAAKPEQSNEDGK